jgi:hypothetical protein
MVRNSRVRLNKGGKVPLNQQIGGHLSRLKHVWFTDIISIFLCAISSQDFVPTFAILMGESEAQPLHIEASYLKVRLAFQREFSARLSNLVYPIYGSTTIQQVMSFP